jgi:hypothetical protein
MAKKTTYRDYLKQEMSDLIDQIDLSPLQKRFIKGRWLDQLLWLEGRATKSRNQHYILRLITIIGGVIVPALVSVSSVNAKDSNLPVIFGWTAFGLSQAVAISAAVEELFSFGEKYRQYRNTAESLKIEGWQFFQLSGSYKDAKNHGDAYTTFATNVENIIQKDVQGFVSQAIKVEEESKAAIDAALTQNPILANKNLTELLQPLPTPGSVPQYSGSSTPVVLHNDGKDKFTTPDPIQGTAIAQANNPTGIGSTSNVSVSVPLVPNSSPVVEGDILLR